MPLLNASVVTTPTSITVSGGTALAFSQSGQVQNGVVLTPVGDTDFRTRRRITCKIQHPKTLASAPNGYSQARCNAEFTVPIILANGRYTFNAISVQLRYDVETSDVQKQALLDMAAQMIIDSDFSAFWKAQSLG